MFKIIKNAENQKKFRKLLDMSVIMKYNLIV